MLFDTPQMNDLLQKYDGQPDYAVPEVVILARSPRFAGERTIIEAIFKSLPDTVRNDWGKRLICADHAQYKSTWFQIMLLDWLNQLGHATPEPEILGNNPDFLVEVGDLKFVIEARAILISDAERSQQFWVSEILWLLNHIEEPSIVIRVEVGELVSRIDAASFLEQVTTWLHTAPETDFQYKDRQGNCIKLTPLEQRERGGVATVGPSSSFWVDSSKLKNPLREKASQHKAIRESEYPYLIAMYLEDEVYSGIEVVESWFGRQTFIVDTLTATVVDQRLDMSGIHYWRQEIRHRTVSGTLVFRGVFDERQKRRVLQSWYIQNPYATKPVDPGLFPVWARFVVKSQTGEHFQMGWESDAIQEAGL